MVHKKTFTFTNSRWFRTISITTLVLITAVTFVYGVYHIFFRKPPKLLYKTQKPERKTIEHVIHTAGYLEIKDAIKVGSLVGGIVKKLYAHENQTVKKGQLLAYIDNGKGDTLVRQAQANVQKLHALYSYQKEFYHRQKQLFLAGHISTDAFQKVTSEYLVSKADVASAQAYLEEKQKEFNNCSIKSPEDGTITDLGVSEGERVQIDLEASVIVYMGKDLNKMEGYLEIDESDIGQLKENQHVRFTVDTYLDTTFSGFISKIGYSPVSKNNIKYYKATFNVDNTAQLLRPGMTIHAKVEIGKAENVLALTHQAFQISQETIKKIARQLGYECEPLAKALPTTKKDPTHSESSKRVWIVRNKKFIEKALTLGITDNIHFHIKSGLTEDDDVIVDAEEPNEMENLYKKWFGGAL